MTPKGKIFVTGGAGFIGSRVVRQLLENGYAVRCLIRHTTDLRRIAGLEYERQVGDITDPESLKSALIGCSGVIHLACLSSWKDIQSSKMKQVVIEGSKNVLTAAGEYGNIKTVYISSSVAINGSDEMVIHNEDSQFTLPPKPEFVYAHAKKYVENYCMDCVKKGRLITIVNPGEVYGPNDYSKITCGNLIDFITTKTVRVARGGTSIVYVDDVAKGIIAALEKGRSGERYILGSENLEIEALAKMTLEVAGIQKPVKLIGKGFLKKLAWISKTFSIPMGFEPAVIPYAVKYWFMDNSKARTELGIDFRGAREILEPTLKWVKEAGFLKS